MLNRAALRRPAWLLVAVQFFLFGSSARAQIRQELVFLDESTGIFTMLSGLGSGGGTFTFPTGGSGTLLTTASTGSITTLGTIVSGKWQATAIAPGYGGTGLATYTPYALLAGGTTTTGNLQQVSVAGAISGQVLTYTSSSTLPTWQTSSSGFTNPMNAAGQMIYGGTSGLATALAISATNGSVLSYNTGTNIPAWVASLPVANGGTGATNANAAFNALSPMSTLGDMMYENGTPASAALSGNKTSTKNFLTSTGASGAATAPAWGTIAGADVPVFVASGSSHAAGAVPDPGATAGSTRFPREDATWVAPNTAMMISGITSVNFSNSVGYWYPQGQAITNPTASIAENDVMMVNRSGTIENFTVTLTAAPTGTGTATLTIYDGVNSTGVTVTFNSSTGTTLSDNTHSYVVSSGNLIYIKASTTGTGFPNMTNGAWAFSIQ